MTITKSAIRSLCAVLALLLVSSAIPCLAKVDRVTVIEGYGNPTYYVHTVYYTLWEYPIVDGQRGSGKPIESSSYNEPHDFGLDGVCYQCGFIKGSMGAEPQPETKSKSKSKSRTETEAPVVKDTFASASGATVTKGTPAAEALKEVFTAIPADTEITVAGVAPEAADKLVDIINNNGDAAQLMELLKAFPVQTIDGVDCYVVTLSYTDATGKPVTENYAFSTANGALVKVF